jgi:hypothetical protein
MKDRNAKQAKLWKGASRKGRVSEEGECGDAFSTHASTRNIGTVGVILRTGRGKGRNNGGSEPNSGTLYMGTLQ